MGGRGNRYTGGRGAGESPSAGTGLHTRGGNFPHGRGGHFAGQQQPWDRGDQVHNFLSQQGGRGGVGGRGRGFGGGQQQQIRGDGNQNFLQQGGRGRGGRGIGNPLLQQPQQQPQVCRDYSASGHCSRGANCRYQHYPPQQPQQQQFQQQFQQQQPRQTQLLQKGNPLLQPRQDLAPSVMYQQPQNQRHSTTQFPSQFSQPQYHHPQQQPQQQQQQQQPFSRQMRNPQICDFFLRGNCRFGNNCGKLHSESTQPSHQQQYEQSLNPQLFAQNAQYPLNDDMDAEDGCNRLADLGGEIAIPPMENDEFKDEQKSEEKEDEDAADPEYKELDPMLLGGILLSCPLGFGSSSRFFGIPEQRI